VSFSLFSPEKTYSPRTAEVQSASGYSQYLTKLRADKATGEVNPADVAAVRADIAQQSGINLNRLAAKMGVQRSR